MPHVLECIRHHYVESTFPVRDRQLFLCSRHMDTRVIGEMHILSLKHKTILTKSQGGEATKAAQEISISILSRHSKCSDW